MKRTKYSNPFDLEVFTANEARRAQEQAAFIKKLEAQKEAQEDIATEIQWMMSGSGE